MILLFAAVLVLFWQAKPDIVFLLFAGAAPWWLLPEAWRATGLERGPEFPHRNPQTTDIQAIRPRYDGGFGEMHRNWDAVYGRRSQ
jgi:hypothetical protein